MVMAEKLSNGTLSFMSTAQRSDKVPPWPSLYDPSVEILHIEHHAPTHSQGAYLYHAKGEAIRKLC